MFFFNRNLYFYFDDCYLVLVVFIVSFNFKVIMEYCDRKREGIGCYIVKVMRILCVVVYVNLKCSGNYKFVC